MGAPSRRFGSAAARSRADISLPRGCVFVPIRERLGGNGRGAGSGRKSGGCFSHAAALEELRETKPAFVKERFISLTNTYSTLSERKKCNMHSNYSDLQYKIFTA